MEKDDRSKNKRNRMRQFKKHHYQNISQNSTASSSPSTPSVTEKLVKQKGVEPLPIPTLSDEEEIDQGTDFNLLQNSAGSGGTFFTFSSEKNWDCNSEILSTSQENKYFALNLKLLNGGLRSIPFYNRMNYPASEFTKQQIIIMDAEAKDAKDQYAEILKITNYPLKVKNSTKKDKKLPNSAKDESKNLKIDNKDDELDELLNFTNENLNNITLVDEKGSSNVLSNEKQQKNEKSIHKNLAGASSNATDDLQDWLDKVLE